MLSQYVIGVWASSVLLLYSMLRCGHVMCASVLLLFSGWEHASVWACYVCFSVAVILWVGACFGVGMLCVLQCCCYSVGRSMLPCGHVMCASVLLLFSGWEHASVWACYVCFSVAVIQWVGACFRVGMLCVLQCCCYSVGGSMLPCGRASVLLLLMLCVLQCCCYSVGRSMSACPLSY